MTSSTDAIDEFEFTSPEIRLELVDGQFCVGGTLTGSQWLLREILQGWGLESAIAFAPLPLWYEALRVAFDAPTPTADLGQWAAQYPYQTPEIPPLGSRHLGEHWHIRQLLGEELRTAVGRASLGMCMGRDFLMRLGEDAFTPDVKFVRANRLTHYHEWFFDGSADLVIEVLLPEQSDIDKVERFRRYAAAGVEHYWPVDPVQQQVTLYRLGASGYEVQPLDSDGCYRGFEGLTFAPSHLWLPYNQKLPVFTAPYQKGDWVIKEVEGEDLGWGSVPFVPQVALEPVSIRFEQFVSWCPEAKLEGYGDKYPIIGGTWGTRNALGMLLMSLGLVETVRLVHPLDWVAALDRVKQQEANDTARRQQWWEVARRAAVALHNTFSVGGVGTIGDLVSSAPLNYWSELTLVIWDAPPSTKLWGALDALKTEDIEFDLVEAKFATPAQWQQIANEMVVLAGSWSNSVTPIRKRLQLFWEEI
ncbi:Uma2 family endonuclease [Microseira wollei]|uniref:Putative restriction endonuclease domain-containing protein n=1 Tax=Microseira wollei NIES-4236 TaxID=2530354 RepID=A0AAV3XPH2_9CYAN|nr:Uma2 family endonuclease [Microseira wollei]GET44253.1 hypothetical protein MiSe_90790 [Microseira wollei NIES-4236]